MLPFPRYIDSLVRRAGLNQNTLAKAVSVTLPFAHQVVRGKRLLPLAEAGRWADALRLSKAERAEFLERVALEHSPDLVAELVERLRSQVSGLQAEVDRLRAPSAVSKVKLRQRARKPATRRS